MSEIQRYIAKTQELPKPHKTYIADEIVVRNDAHEAALRERDERIAALEKAIKNLLNWYSHEMPQWESGTQKAMDDAEKLLEAK